MSDLPNGVDSDTMRWAIAWRIVENAAANFLGGRADFNEKANALKEKTKEVYKYLSEKQPLKEVSINK